MIRLPMSICAVLLTGCASLPEPPPALEPDVPSGAPWGLAWIPPSGEVAIKAGAVEHVLYPEATTQKPALMPVIPRTSVDSAFRGSPATSHPARHRAQPAVSVKSDVSLQQCDLEKEPVPAWFFFKSVRASQVSSQHSGDACAVRKQACQSPSASD